jgi:type I restriction enzyme S subunit
MNAAQLFTHFDRISEAPDAVSRLRGFILNLAVRGKLVEQDPKDEPASELLKRIQAERPRLTKRGQIKKTESSSLYDDGKPFAIPDNWTWTRLGEIAEWGSGSTPPRGNHDFYGGEISWLKSGELNDNPQLKGSEETVTESALEKCSFRKNQPGDVLIAMYGATIGKVAILAEPAVTNQAVCGCTPFPGVFNLYLFKFLLSQRVQFHSASEGGAQPNISKVKIVRFQFPLPPLAEQHRIVAKVDELMALCDQLEAAQATRETRRDQLTAASLNRLNEPADADTPTFREHARFHLRQLPRFTARPDQMPQLRQTILNLAVRGKVVPQDSNHESVLILLAQSDRTRQAMAKEDRRADAEPQTLLAPQDRWEVPSSWEWRGLADLVLFIDYRGKTPAKFDSGVRLITAKNVKKGFINSFPDEFLSESDYRSWMTRGFPKEGDVLFTTEAPLGNAATVRLRERFALAQRVICFRPYGAINPDFLVLQLLSQPFQSILDKTATGLTAKGIKAAKLKRLQIAVPPLSEQRCIVAKVDELLALCDRLEAQLTTAQNESRQLLESVLHEALSVS